VSGIDELGYLMIVEREKGVGTSTYRWMLLPCFTERVFDNAG